MPLIRLRAVGTILLLLVLALPGPAPAADDQERVIVRVAKPYDDLINAVRGLGGNVSQKYDNVDAIAVSVPKGRLAELTALVGANAITKDTMVAPPQPVNVATVSSGDDSVDPSIKSGDELRAVVSASPLDYNFNNSLIGATAVHAAGHVGTGVVVAIIDSGTANSPVVAALSIGGVNKVIGGESFVPTDLVTSATSRRNGPHGTWVGTVIASNVAFGFGNASTIIRSLKAHAPSAIVGSCPNPPAVATCFVAMIGVAPDSRLYALKVFKSTAGGTPESIVMAAMDKAITLKRKFDEGIPSVPVGGTGTEEDPYRYDSLNIRVVNMSLGGGTLFAGRDLEDQLTKEMVEVGITLAASAGNDGPAAMTGGSPGTGLGSLTVGAANTPMHERVLRDNQFGLGIGALYRPSSHIQTADFSSRGPTADGRIDPDLTANGYATFAQGTCNGLTGAQLALCLAGGRQATINFVSGTSFSGPTAAGAAALLRGAAPSASAVKVRNALHKSANPNVLGDNSTKIDQGKGFLDVSAALSRLNSGHVSSRLPDDCEGDDRDQHGQNGGNNDCQDPSHSVQANVQKAGFRPIQFTNNSFTTRVSDLVPGQMHQFFVATNDKTDRIVVSLTNIVPELPPAQQNQLFGDDVFLNIVDAPTSFAELRASAFVFANSSFTIDQPQTGLMRVALQGDWTNAGKISTDVTITRTQGTLSQPTASDHVAEGETVPIEVEVPGGKTQAVFEVFWKDDWSRYPTDDIDMILVDPNGNVNVDGATLSAPERVVVANPTGGLWTVLVQGFAIHDHDDDNDDDHHAGGPAQEKFTLRGTADGVRLRKAN
jgi:subtilase family protein